MRICVWGKYEYIYYIYASISIRGVIIYFVLSSSCNQKVFWTDFFLEQSNRFACLYKYTISGTSYIYSIDLLKNSFYITKSRLCGETCCVRVYNACAKYS